MAHSERATPQPVYKLSIRYDNQKYVFNLEAGDSQVESSTEIQDGVFAAVLTAKQILSTLPVSDEANCTEEMNAFYEFLDERVRIPINLQGHDSQMLGGFLRGYAAYIFEKLLPTDIKHLLGSLPESSTLTLDLDEKSSPIPWELANNGSKSLHMKFSCSRTLKAPSTKGNPTEPSQQRLVIVANPTGNLPGASTEANYIVSQLMGMRQVRIARFGQELTKKTFLDLLKGTQCNMLHYSGHSKESQESQEQSFLLLRDGPCYARDIQNALTETPPFIVFVDSCLSASQLQYGTTSIASSFLKAGVKNYVGALWPVSDNGAAMFASDFYRFVIHGNSIGESLRRARLASFSKWQYNDIVWSSYILYGDPTTRLFSEHN